MPNKRAAALGELIHIEVYVVPRRHRTEFRRLARKPIAIARDITRNGGGRGPEFYRVEPQPASGGVPRLRNVFKVRSNEDLWVEITFYPNKRSRRDIMREVWTNKELAAAIEALEALNSKRPGAWAIANAVLQPI